MKVPLLMYLTPPCLANNFECLPIVELDPLMVTRPSRVKVFHIFEVRAGSATVNPELVDQLPAIDFFQL